MTFAIDEFARDLNLEVLTDGGHTGMEIDSMDTNRPGMQFCGYYEFFAVERAQLIGKMEMSYLCSLTEEKQKEILDRYMTHPIPCIIICWGMDCPSILKDCAEEHHVPLFRSQYKTTRFSLQLILYLNGKLAPKEICHGVLMDVYGVGILITGESGVGKSEAALELIKRGHQLVADDAVEIRRVADDRLIGKSPEMIRHFMEIRGIGIIDIRQMFGIGAVMESKTINMVIHMEKWNSEKEYERFGLNENQTEILGVKLPYQVMPVKPGRNVAVIIEVAARKFSLKRVGYSAAEELDHRLNEMIQDADKHKS